MAWLLIKGIAIAGTGLKALGKVAHFSGLLDSFSSSSKNVTLFKLGDWIRLKVGGESYVTKKKTLNRIEPTVFSHLLEADKLIDIPKIQMLKMRLLNQMNITVIPSTGKIKFGKIPKKEKEKETHEKEAEKTTETKTEENLANEKEGEKEEGKPEIPVKTDDTHTKEHKERFEKDQDGFWMIDRDPKHFPAILNYLRTGIVTTEEADLDELLVEAQFYQIEPLVAFIEHTLLEIRRKKERKAVLEHDLKGFAVDKPYFAVSHDWVVLWKDFIYNHGKPAPPIDNKALVDSEYKPIQGKTEGTDYVFVNSDVWMTWWLIYGGGPIIARKLPELYSNNVLSTLWHWDGGKESEVKCEPPGACKNDGKELKTEGGKESDANDRIPEETKITHDSKIIEEAQKLKEREHPEFNKVTEKNK